jgi:predicted transcriptional regulator
MKTAISIPDPIFHEAERLARRLKKSRSQLYAEAMTDYLRRHDADAVTDALNRVCAESGEPADPFGAAAARRLLSNVEW